LLVKKDYLDPCIYGEDGDEELTLDIDGDNDENTNHCFTDLNLQKLNNVMANGCQCNIHFEIWAINAFDAWHKL
jgi:hypothetical protein